MPRFMMVIKAAESGQQPPVELMEAMEKHILEWTEKGQLIDTAGLAPTAQGVRVRLEGGMVSVHDGPFTEAKEVIGGYAIMEFDSKEDAIQSAKDFMELHKTYWPEFEGESEVRQIFTTAEEHGWEY
jgi:hypothetical protein